MRTIPCIVFALACLGASDAAAQVRHCVTSEGGSLYTDRQCETLGASEQPVTTAQAVAATTRAVCTRTVHDLIFEVGAAIDANDPNRLASLYHWTGMSTDDAYAIVGRLDEIAQRPLLEIVPLLPGDGHGYLSTQHAPVGLRIEQTLANGDTPSRTEFGLQRHYGCWWIRG